MCEGVFGPRKENNNLKSPCWTFRSRPDAPGWLYLPGTYQPLSRNLPPPTSARDLTPPAQLQMPSQLKNTQNIPPNVSLIASTNLPLNMKSPWSLFCTQSGLWPTVTPPCLNKGNLPPLRLSLLLFCLSLNYTLRCVCPTSQDGISKANLFYSSSFRLFPKSLLSPVLLSSASGITPFQLF